VVAQKATDEEVVAAVARSSSMTLAARALDMTERNLYYRLSRIESDTGQRINRPDGRRVIQALLMSDGRIDVEITDGVILVGSDAHYRPKVISTAHRALCHFAKELKPKVIIKNGDALDFPGISRHAPIGWETRPSVIQEIECAQERLGEIEAAAEKAQRIWPLGNHDMRFESRIANVAPEYARIHGVHLKDHFPLWEPCWGVWVNDNVVIKHRYKSGIHATHNNTVNAGVTMVTGHLHSLKVTPFSDYTGTRWGVDTGTLADPYSDAFRDYTELNPTNWRSGFAVLTFHKGQLLWPEVVHVIGDGQVEFRGQVLDV
jgi:hypothetical protein